MGATTDDDGVGSLHARLGEILEQAGHDEVWQVKLEPLPSRRASTLLVLTKFLAAWDGNVDKAAEALLATLRWRKDYFRLDREAQARGQDMSEHSRRALDDPRFKGLGYVVRVEHQDEDRESVITFNIYGAVDDVNATFSDLDNFLRWRVMLMERGIAQLDLESVSGPISDDNDPYRMIQVHDYLNVSFLRMSSATKAASQKTIEIMSQHYPELMSAKAFCNVPWVMSWCYAAVKMLLPARTTKKFVMLTHASEVAAALQASKAGASLDVARLPRAYGGASDESLEQMDLSARRLEPQTRRKENDDVSDA